MFRSIWCTIELPISTVFAFRILYYTSAEPVTVGWGKKETQFHGSEGKQAASKKDIIETQVMGSDDKQARIRYCNPIISIIVLYFGKFNSKKIGPNIFKELCIYDMKWLGCTFSIYYSPSKTKRLRLHAPSKN